MQWYYAQEGQPTGPCSEEQLQQLASEGKVGPTTLVWREGLAEWQPYSALQHTPLPPVASTLPPVITNQAQCVECRQWFALDDLLAHGGAHVCARCKPVYFQKLREGVSVVGPAGHQVWRMGNLLVMAREAQLPDRCVKCNAPAESPKLVRKLYWHSPYWYLLIFISILIYAIVALLIRKKAVVEIGLCAAHAASRRRSVWLGWGSFLMLILSVVLGVALETGWLALGAVFFLITAIGFAWHAQQVAPAFIDERFVKLRGAKEPFLATFHEWRG